MRPLRLKIKSFTAFRDEQDIDFEHLDVFAVAGPTGSGKSSLLDAVTYALFGYVERVGKQVGQLVSQGQPRLAVSLEFRVSNRDYRIARSTPSGKGATKIILERRDGDGWVQAGEGADRVRECDAMIHRLIGLDYEAFTRSVLLPQGKFAEFLVGDPRERRDILTELLGLTLFKRMAERAGAIARDEGTRAATMRDLLEREYAGVDEQALAEAKGAAGAARKREQQLARAGERVGELLERWEEEGRASVELAECAAEARRLAGTAAQAADALSELVQTRKEAEHALEERSKEAVRAGAAATGAREARERAEAEWGRPADLAALRTRAQELTSLRRDAISAREEASAIEGAIPGLEEALAAARAALDAATRAVEEATAGEASARSALEELAHADQVANLVAELSRGDPCPVCGEPLTTIPSRPGAQSLRRARADLERAEEALRRAEATARDSERSRDVAERDLGEGRKDTGRAREHAESCRRALADREREMVAALGDVEAERAAEVLDHRIGELESLREVEQREERAADAAERERLKAERERDLALATVAGERARLEFDSDPLIDRARRAAGDLTLTPVSSLPDTDEPDRLADHGRSVAEWLTGLAENLAETSRKRASSEPDLLAKAHRAVGNLIPACPDLASLAGAVTRALREAGGEAAAAEQRAEDLASRLQRRAELEDDVRAGEARTTRFRALAGELRADRLIDFLQREALAVLAAGASLRLTTLSGGRYRLECRADVFYVIDTWNGEEARSVRTLSGGETFLASLSLALALSEQVRSLSVTDRAPLDSLFLDEGFGTLDPETLAVVVEAIERLAGDGRLVGVITHVPELFREFPRFEIDKTTRGSSVHFVA